MYLCPTLLDLDSKSEIIILHRLTVNYFHFSGHAVFKCQCKTLISSIDNVISTNFLTSEGAGALVDKIFNADLCTIQKVENHFIRKAICIKCRRKIGHSKGSTDWKPGREPEGLTKRFVDPWTVLKCR